MQKKPPMTARLGNQNRQRNEETDFIHLAMTGSYFMSNQCAEVLFRLWSPNLFHSIDNG